MNKNFTTLAFAPSTVHLSGSSSTGSFILTVATTLAAIPGTYNITPIGRDGGSFNFKTANVCVFADPDATYYSQRFYRALTTH